MNIPKRESLFIAIVLFLTLGTAVSAQATFGGPNPVSMLALGLVIFLICSIVLGVAKIAVYHVWHSESTLQAKTFYLLSSGAEVASLLLIGFLFHFNEAVMFSMLAVYWILETLINPLLLKRISPSKHAAYVRELPLSLIQAFALPSLGFVIYLITGLSQ